MITYTYRSTNGYSGILRVGRSLSIYDSDFNEVLHTLHPKPKNYNELKEQVDRFPEFINILFGGSHEK